MSPRLPAWRSHVGSLCCSELMALQAKEVAFVAGRLRLRLERGMTDQVGQGAEVGRRRGRHSRPARCGCLTPGRHWRSGTRARINRSHCC